MDQELPDTNKTEKKEEEPDFLLYRGIGRNKEGSIGHWWSTNPYYALRYAQGGKGEVYWVKMKKLEIERLSSDVSLEDNYQNYFFKEDPPNAERATNEQLEILKSKTIFAKSKGPGGVMMKTPENAVEIGKEIFAHLR